MEKKKLLIIGDLHLKVANLNIAQILFELIAKWIVEYDITDLIFLGDIYDTKAIIRSEAQNFLIEHLSDISRRSKVYTHIIVGNHDYENLQCHQNSLTPLNLINNVFIYNELFCHNDLSCAFVPFRPTNELFLKDIETIKDCNNIQTVFCHQGLAGFDLGSGFLDKTGITTNDLPKTLKFIVGHYHKPQADANVIYLGTPFSHSFGETNHFKHIGVFDVNTSNLTLVDTGKFLPQHYSIHWSSINSAFNADSEPYLNAIKDGDLVETIIHCTSDEIATYNSDFILSKLSTTNITLRVKYDIIDNTRNVRLKEGSSLEQLLSQYLEIKGKSDLLEDGLAFLKDASI